MKSFLEWMENIDWMPSIDVKFMNMGRDRVCPPNRKERPPTCVSPMQDRGHCPRRQGWRF